MTSKTYADYGSMTAHADCDFCGTWEQPSLRTFMDISPMKRNYKTISAKTEQKIYHWKFDWHLGKPCYVSIKHPDITDWIYVGCYDVEKNQVHKVPNGMDSDAELFLMTNVMLMKFENRTFKYIYDVL